MNIKHKNHKDDMKLLVSLGQEYTGEPFKLTFTSGRYGVVSYVCSYDGIEYTNCEMADSTHVLCLLDNHGLPCGTVSVEIQICIPDTQMEDGNFRVNSKKVLEIICNGETYNLELTNGVSDDIETDETTLELLGNVIRGKDGTKVDVSPTYSEGTIIATISLDGIAKQIKVPTTVPATSVVFTDNQGNRQTVDAYLKKVDETINQLIESSSSIRIYVSEGGVTTEGQKDFTALVRRVFGESYTSIDPGKNLVCTKYTKAYGANQSEVNQGVIPFTRRGYEPPYQFYYTNGIELGRTTYTFTYKGVFENLTYFALKPGYVWFNESMISVLPETFCFSDGVKSYSSFNQEVVPSEWNQEDASYMYVAVPVGWTIEAVTYSRFGVSRTSMFEEFTGVNINGYTVYKSVDADFATIAGGSLEFFGTGTLE